MSRPSKRQVITAVNQLIRPAGIRVHCTSRPTRTWREAFEHLRQVGYQPPVVVDVGVLMGTPDLYAAFPESRFVLFEPLKRFEPHLQAICRQFNATYHLVAAGDRDGTVEFVFKPDDPGNSSRNVAGASPTAERLTVPIVRLDSVLKADDLGTNAMLKVDVEGTELSVIEGCVGLLPACFEAIVLETRFFKYGPELFEFSEVVTRMSQLGYAVYDILDGGYRADGVLDLVDLLFVRANGQVRSRIAGRKA
jgi:FkbM family methyltransferase